MGSWVDYARRAWRWCPAVQVKHPGSCSRVDGLAELMQHKTLVRLLEAGDGGFLGGMTTDKHSKMNKTSKPTAARDLTQLQAWGSMAVTGVGKGTRYAVNVAGWNC